MERISAIVEQLPEFTLNELEYLNSHLQLALRFRKQNELSVDLPSAAVRETHSPLADSARVILQGIEVYELTLADQCLLAAIILEDCYGQENYSSRSIHDEVKLNGRPPIAHITSAIGNLLEKNYLLGSTREAHLSPQGKAKGRTLIRLFQSREETERQA